MHGSCSDKPQRVIDGEQREGMRASSGTAEMLCSQRIGTRERRAPASPGSVRTSCIHLSPRTPFTRDDPEAGDADAALAHIKGSSKGCGRRRHQPPSLVTPPADRGPPKAQHGGSPPGYTNCGAEPSPRLTPRLTPGPGGSFPEAAPGARSPTEDTSGGQACQGRPRPGRAPGGRAGPRPGGRPRCSGEPPASPALRRRPWRTGRTPPHARSRRRRGPGRRRRGEGAVPPPAGPGARRGPPGPGSPSAPAGTTAAAPGRARRPQVPIGPAPAPAPSRPAAVPGGAGARARPPADAAPFSPAALSARGRRRPPRRCPAAMPRGHRPPHIAAARRGGAVPVPVTGAAMPVPVRSQR